MSNSQTTLRDDGPGSSTGATPSSADEIDSFLAWRVVRTGRAVERALSDTLAEHDLTTTEAGVLSLLASGADLTQSDLARAVLVRPQSVGPLIASLVERGLIARRGPGGRGRRSYFDLTPPGRHLIAQAWSQLSHRYGTQQLGLVHGDAQTLDRLLTALETAATNVER